MGLQHFYFNDDNKVVLPLKLEIPETSKPLLFKDESTLTTTNTKKS